VLFGKQDAQTTIGRKIPAKVNGSLPVAKINIKAGTVLPVPFRREQVQRKSA